MPLVLLVVVLLGITAGVAVYTRQRHPNTDILAILLGTMGGATFFWLAVTRLSQRARRTVRILVVVALLSVNVFTGYTAYFRAQGPGSLCGRQCGHTFFCPSGLDRSVRNGC